MEAGVEGFRHRGIHGHASAGSLILINPEEMHTGYAADDYWTYRMFYPSVALMQNAASELLGQAADVPIFPSVAPHDAATARRLILLHQSLELTGTELEHQSHLLWTLGHLIFRHTHTHPPLRPIVPENKAVTAVKEYLQQKYRENVRLDELAALTGLSAFHLLRVFRAHVGLPPHAYLNQIRVERSRSLLRLGMPLGETALEVGFADQSHFTRHFKRLVGVTPGRYEGSNTRSP